MCDVCDGMCRWEEGEERREEEGEGGEGGRRGEEKEKETIKPKGDSFCLL